jgi:hypothetical protein
MSPKFFTVFPELKADIQQAPAQPDASPTDFEGGGNSLNMGASQGLESLPNPFIEGEGFSNMGWPGNQPNMRVGEV